MFVALAVPPNKPPPLEGVAADGVPPNKPPPGVDAGPLNPALFETPNAFPVEGVPEVAPPPNILPPAGAPPVPVAPEPKMPPLPEDAGAVPEPKMPPDVGVDPAGFEPNSPVVGAVPVVPVVAPNRPGVEGFPEGLPPPPNTLPPAGLSGVE